MLDCTSWLLQMDERLLSESMIETLGLPDEEGAQ